MTEQAVPVPQHHPVAAEMMRQVLYHNREDLEHIVQMLTERGYSTTDVVIWLTKSNERLGFKDPIWCTREQVERWITGERIIG